MYERENVFYLIAITSFTIGQETPLKMMKGRG